MESISEELIKLLSREDLEDAIRRLNSEVSELRDEVKFWRCRAEASSKEQGKVLIRSSISEEMLNELNNLAGKMDVLKIADDGVNKENKEDSDSISNGKSIQKPFASAPPASSALGAPSDSNSLPETENVSRTAINAKLKSMILKKAPPKMMSRADFVKKSELKSSGAGIKGNGNSEISAQSQISGAIKKLSSRISLQWGCLAEEYPKFDHSVEENLFKDYFSEFEEKLSVLVNNKESIEESKIELSSNSVFSKDFQTEELQIPSEKLFEWFIKKEGINDKKITMINNQAPSNTKQSALEQDKLLNMGDKSINKEKILADKKDQKQTEAAGSETRACIFGSKTSRMLQITINYFKKKLPKNQQKNLDFFKKSILQCTLDKEGANLLLETVPDPCENAAKYEVWKECVTSVEKYLENNSRETLFEEEEFVYFLSRIPNLSKRLECMILRSSFEQLYLESLKWIEEKIRGLELILNHKRLPLLFKTVVDSRNILNSKLGKENQQEPDKVKFIPLSSLKKLQSLKSPNIQGKTLLNFISSIVGEIFTAEEISILKKSSEKNITMVYTMVTDLIFSWLELRDGSENLVLSTDTHSIKDGIADYSDEFQNIMKLFYSEKYSQMIKLCSSFRRMLKLYVASCYYFGDISTFLPIGAKSLQRKNDLFETLFEFISKYNVALKQEAAKEGDQISPKSVENTPRENSNKLFASGNTSARRLSHINDMKNILSSEINSRPKELFAKSLNINAKPKINIQQIFAKSIVRELNLKPLFNMNSENRVDRHVSFSDGKSETSSNNSNSVAGDLKIDSDKMTEKDAILGTSKAKVEIRNSILSENIEETMALSLEPFCGKNQETSDKTSAMQVSEQGRKGKRFSILELSKEAKEILSRNSDSTFNMNLSSSFDDDVSLDDDDDNETIALSSPSYTRILDISSILDSKSAQGEESCNKISSKLEEDSTRKKVVIIAEDYDSPVRNNTKFNRRQSIRRMCQIATYLDNSGYNDEIEEANDDLNNTLSKYKSPMVRRKASNHSYHISSSPFSSGTENSQEVNLEYDQEFENDNSKTCVLSDILEISNPLDDLKKPNVNKENDTIIHSSNHLNQLQNINNNSKGSSEYSPQKITFTRKSGRFGSTLSPPYN
ncbi:Formin Homology 2 Domain family protein [Cryptosporidium meleagridis]|uniref:Formin Homology 2 Domain family protein n=1 Tax=Cryptosporidium meleagridis TaxID=93969 RepID=A0A2P4YZ92_9CRYT|nr:Formin Homology 2 Domain family protein [Cryptosporidium meleagridis]